LATKQPLLMSLGVQQNCGLHAGS